MMRRDNNPTSRLSEECDSDSEGLGPSSLDILSNGRKTPTSTKPQPVGGSGILGKSFSFTRKEELLSRLTFGRHSTSSMSLSSRGGPKPDSGVVANGDGNNTCKSNANNKVVINKPDPSARFQGDGEVFKVKLIGSREVPDRNGDQMAQEALIALKESKKVKKLRVNLHVSLDGIMIRRTDKSKEVLQRHPVALISFIAVDKVDQKIFGYICSSPIANQNGVGITSAEPIHRHTIYAIKTPKTANPLVLCIRDLFHTVFEMRKRELVEKHTLREQDFTGSQGDRANSLPPTTDIFNTSFEKCRPTTVAVVNDSADTIQIVIEEPLSPSPSALNNTTSTPNCFRHPSTASSANSQDWPPLSASPCPPVSPFCNENWNDGFNESTWAEFDGHERCSSVSTIDDAFHSNQVNDSSHIQSPLSSLNPDDLFPKWSDNFFNQDTTSWQDNNNESCRSNMADSSIGSLDRSVGDSKPPESSPFSDSFSDSFVAPNFPEDPNDQLLEAVDDASGDPTQNTSQLKSNSFSDNFGFASNPNDDFLEGSGQFGESSFSNDAFEDNTNSEDQNQNVDKVPISCSAEVFPASSEFDDLVLRVKTGHLAASRPKSAPSMKDAVAFMTATFSPFKENKMASLEDIIVRDVQSNSGLLIEEETVSESEKSIQVSEGPYVVFDRRKPGFFETPFSPFKVLKEVDLKLKVVAEISASQLDAGEECDQVSEMPFDDDFLPQKRVVKSESAPCFGETKPKLADVSEDDLFWEQLFYAPVVPPRKPVAKTSDLLLLDIDSPTDDLSKTAEPPVPPRPFYTFPAPPLPPRVPLDLPPAFSQSSSPTPSSSSDDSTMVQRTPQCPIFPAPQLIEEEEEAPPLPAPQRRTSSSVQLFSPTNPFLSVMPQDLNPVSPTISLIKVATGSTPRSSTSSSVDSPSLVSSQASSGGGYVESPIDDVFNQADTDNYLVPRMNLKNSAATTQTKKADIFQPGDNFDPFADEFFLSLAGADNGNINNIPSANSNQIHNGY